MKKHPIITSVYVLLSFTIISLALRFFVFWYSPYNPDNSHSGNPDAVLNNMYFAIYSSVVLVMVAVTTAGFLQAKIKGVAQYIFYFVLTILLPVPITVYHMTHCNGKFCGAGDFVVSSFLAGFSVGTIIVYYLGKFLVKRGYLPKFIKFLYILAFVLFVIVAPFYIATEFFRFDYTRFDYIFKPWFDNLNLDWLSTYISSFMSIATVTIPALIFAIYPLKIAEAEYKDKE